MTLDSYLGLSPARGIHYTIGYGGRPWKEFVGLLREYKIQLVIDVRRRPDSAYSSSYCRDVLATSLPREVISYVAYRHLGPPSEILPPSHKRSEESWSRFVASYGHYMRTSPVFEEYLSRLLLPGNRGRTLCLLCAEKKAAMCHRRLLAEYIEEREENWKFVHIE